MAVSPMLKLKYPTIVFVVVVVVVFGIPIIKQRVYDFTSKFVLEKKKSV